jgi:hypothetical protein
MNNVSEFLRGILNNKIKMINDQPEPAAENICL